MKRDINENSESAKTRSSRSYLLEVGPIVKNDATDSSSQNGTNYFNNYFELVMKLNSNTKSKPSYYRKIGRSSASFNNTSVDLIFV